MTGEFRKGKMYKLRLYFHDSTDPVGEEKQMRLYAPMENVLCGGEKARILTVSVGRELDILYKIGFWSHGEWKEAWVPPEEVEDSK